jgi:hypothetical protein
LEEVAEAKHNKLQGCKKEKKKRSASLKAKLDKD